jgi:acyl-CoA thioesterase-1
MKFPKLLGWAASLAVGLAAVSVQAQIRILPLGDSITSSIAPHVSYRYWLWHSLVNANYNVDFVGTQFGVADGAPAKTDFDQNHEGHPGWETTDAIDNINGILSATHPDVVLLDLGSNDIENGVRIATVRDNLRFLVERMAAANSEIRIIVATPSPYKGSFSSRLSVLRDSIIVMVNAEHRAGIHVAAVDLYSGFSVKNDTFDGVHPNQNGEKLIASRFFQRLKAVMAKM